MGKSSSILGYGVIGNTRDFGSLILGSSPGGLTISRDRLEMVPAQSHKLIYVGSIPTPATIIIFN